MSVRSIGLVLLVWFPGFLHAGSTQSCQAPGLNHGYLVPDQPIYDHDSILRYGCDRGHKPAVKGWWATVTCQNGKWSHKPKCIDKSACLPINVPNGKYSVKSAGWYKSGSGIRITCDRGYEHANGDVTQCVNEHWSPVPVCQKSQHTCGAPPKRPHAVIVGEEYKEVFAHGSEVQYECEDRFTTQGTNTQTRSFCENGVWREGPTCLRIQDAAGSIGRRETSLGGRTQSTGGGSPTSSSGTDSQLQYTTINTCGPAPIVVNGDFVEKESLQLKYQCGSYYTLVGSPIVKCFSNGSWTEAPTCKDSYCSVNTGDYPHLVNVGTSILKSGESLQLECAGDSYYKRVSEFQCEMTKVTAKPCAWPYG